MSLKLKWFTYTRITAYYLQSVLKKKFLHNNSSKYFKNKSFRSGIPPTNALKYLSHGFGALLGASAVSGVSVLAESASKLSTQLLLQQADDLYGINKFDDLYSLLVAHKETGNADVLWRLGRATYSRSLGMDDNTQRDALIREALSYVEQALAIDDSNFAVHKWMAILLDAVGALDGTKARIKQTFIVKEHMERTCELNPKDGTAWHVLGIWHYSIADIPWYQRKILPVLFATPPESSFEEALEVFLHAESVEPNFYSKNLLYIGKCYLQLQQKEQAAVYLRRARDYIKSVSHPTQDDKESKEEAEQLLKGL